MRLLLASHRKTVWVVWLVGAVLFLAVGNELIYGLAIPLSAGLLVLIAPGLVPGNHRGVDGRDIRSVLLFYVGVVTALYLAFQVFTGVFAAAGLYALYHVGYGMGAREMMFLFALGLVYGVAYACVRNVLVLWPVLIPIGSFYNNLQSGGFELPWTAILGFVDVMAVMFTAMWLGHRKERRMISEQLEQPPAAVARM